MSFYINVDPSIIMRIIEFKNRVKDKIGGGIDLDKKGCSIDSDLKGLLDNLEQLEETWEEQMGLSE